MADELVVAIGRRPHTDDLGVDSVGLEPGESIEVDDRLRATGVDGDWLYAIGDVNGRALLTHMGKYQARVAADVILGKDAARAVQRRPRLATGDLHRPPGGGGGAHAAERAGGGARRPRVVDASTSGNAGASFYGRDAPGHRPARDRRGPRG